MDDQLESCYGTDLDLPYVGDSCEALSFVGSLSVGPQPVTGA